MILGPVYRFTGALNIAWLEVRHGYDVTVCTNCGRVYNLKVVDPDFCAECGGRLDEVDPHYRE